MHDVQQRILPVEWRLHRVFDFRSNKTIARSWRFRLPLAMCNRLQNIQWLDERDMRLHKMQQCILRVERRLYLVFDVA